MHRKLKLKNNFEEFQIKMTHFGNLNPYEIHKKLINDYILKQPGDTKLLQRDITRDRIDRDIIRENHRFLWEDNAANTWEEQLAKRYYDKLFKEYCITDLSRYKENKVGLHFAIVFLRDFVKDFLSKR